MNVFSRILITTVCGLFSFGYAALSWGVEWQYYYQTKVEKENKTVKEKLYFDASSIERPQKDIVRVMHKATQLGTDEKTETDSKMTQVEMNCSSRKYRYLSIIEYEEDTGKVVSEERNNNGPWIQFYLDSVMAGLYDNICFEKKQSKKPEKQADKGSEKQPAK